MGRTLATTLAEALKINARLRELWIEGDVGDEVGEAFTEALQTNTSLTKLKILSHDNLDSTWDEEPGFPHAELARNICLPSFW